MTELTKAIVNNTVIGRDEISTGTVKAHKQFFGQVLTTAEELDLNNEYAAAVVYLRTQEYWSQDLEDELISLYRNNKSVPNMLRWGR